MENNPLQEIIDEYNNALAGINEILKKKKAELKKLRPNNKKAYILKGNIIRYESIKRDLIYSISMMRKYNNKEIKHYENKGCFKKRND